MLNSGSFFIHTEHKLTIVTIVTQLKLSNINVISAEKRLMLTIQNNNLYMPQFHPLVAKIAYIE